MYTYVSLGAICIHKKYVLAAFMPKVVFPEMYFYSQSVRPTDNSYIVTDGYRRMYERIDGKFVAIGWIVDFYDPTDRSKPNIRVTAFDKEIPDFYRVKK